MQCLALTDHDTLAGIPEAKMAADSSGIRLIPGVEISSRWKTQEIHIVGLNVQTDAESLLTFLERQQRSRDTRAKDIAAALARQGIQNVYEDVSRLAKHGNIVRPHFAQVLVQRGIVNSWQQAFERYLKRGKCAYVPTKWPVLNKVIASIQAAGGMAVLAHPMRYKLTMTKLKLLLGEFKSAGGNGVEVVTATQSINERNNMARLAVEYGLLASQGSDFHGPSTYANLGQLSAMPDICEPIWNRLDA